jgi:GH24 family phage-related lysozyme (muramidase)
MAYTEAPHKAFTGLGEPDSTKLNPETGDSSYYYSGTFPPAVQSGLGLLGSVGNLLGFGGGGVTEGNSPPGDMNKLEQPANNVSSLYNQNDSNQTQLANQSYDPNGVSEDPNIQPDSLRRMGESQNNMFDDLPNEHGLTDNMRMTKKFEGQKEHVYIDTEGNPTYGIGHKLTEDELGLFGLSGQSYAENQDFEDLRVSKQKIDEVFPKDYANAQNSAQNVLGLGDSDYQNIPENIRGIVTDMVFNMGATGLLQKFPNFLSDVRAGDYDAAASQLKFTDPSLDMSSEGESAYFKQTKDRAQAHYDTLSNYSNYDTLSNY